MIIRNSVDLSIVLLKLNLIVENHYLNMYVFIIAVDIETLKSSSELMYKRLNNSKPVLRISKAQMRANKLLNIILQKLNENMCM